MSECRRTKRSSECCGCSSSLGAGEAEEEEEGTGQLPTESDFGRQWSSRFCSDGSMISSDLVFVQGGDGRAENGKRVGGSDHHEPEKKQKADSVIQHPAVWGSERNNMCFVTCICTRYVSDFRYMRPLLCIGLGLCRSSVRGLLLPNHYSPSQTAEKRKRKNPPHRPNYSGAPPCTQNPKTVIANHIARSNGGK